MTLGYFITCKMGTITLTLCGSYKNRRMYTESPGHTGCHSAHSSGEDGPSRSSEELRVKCSTCVGQLWNRSLPNHGAVTWADLTEGALVRGGETSFLCWQKMSRASQSWDIFWNHPWGQVENVYWLISDVCHHTPGRVGVVGRCGLIPAIQCVCLTVSECVSVAFCSDFSFCILTQFLSTLKSTLMTRTKYFPSINTPAI